MRNRTPCHYSFITKMQNSVWEPELLDSGKQNIISITMFNFTSLKQLFIVFVNVVFIVLKKTALKVIFFILFCHTFLETGGSDLFHPPYTFLQNFPLSYLTKALLKCRLL